MKKIVDYLEDVYEYPPHEELITGLKPGIGFDYVATPYLNAMINYVDILDAGMIRRYMTKEEFDTSTQRIMDFIQSKDTHTNTSNCALYDDILILGRTKDLYVYFWSDCDSSDSNIGAIATDTFNGEKEAIESFRLYLQWLIEIDTAKEAFIIPKEFFRGWITL